MKGEKLPPFCLMGLLALATSSAQAKNPKWWATDEAPTRLGIRISHRAALKWKVQWQGPGFERQAIPKSALLYRAANSAQAPRVED
jgi:hypothetical protein